VRGWAAAARWLPSRGVAGVGCELMLLCVCVSVCLCVCVSVCLCVQMIHITCSVYLSYREGCLGR
jgi:hypothetical protein